MEIKKVDELLRQAGVRMFHVEYEHDAEDTAVRGIVHVENSYLEVAKKAVEIYPYMKVLPDYWQNKENRKQSDKPAITIDNNHSSVREEKPRTKKIYRET